MYFKKRLILSTKFLQMRKLFLTVLAGFALVSLSYCQTNPKSKDVKDKKSPEIVFETTSHDFGTVPFDGNGTYDFVFKNTGKEPLVLSNVHASCGCTSPEWPRQPIKKGEKAVIKVKYNTKIVGAFTKYVTVTSNAKTASVTLTIKGMVEDVKK